MTHMEDLAEQLHHLLYGSIRGTVGEAQYVGTVKMGEEELEETLFKPTGAHYNWLAYWKRHAHDGRDSTGSWKLRHPKHSQYVDRGMQVHITLLPAAVGEDGWLDVYAHYEDDNIKRPIKHLKEVHFSAEQGVNKARRYFHDNGISLYDLHQDYRPALNSD